jgi:hypothetical protein
LGLSYYYSPFASIQPYGWFNGFYPTYGYYTPFNGSFGHNYGYGYMPVYLGATNKTPGVRRPLLGGYANNNYNNSNNRSRIPADICLLLTATITAGLTTGIAASIITIISTVQTPALATATLHRKKLFTFWRWQQFRWQLGGGVTRQPRR